MVFCAGWLVWTPRPAVFEGVRKTSAAKTAINVQNLEALGTTRLAELLVEISAGNAATRRRLRLELAAEKSPGDVAKEVR